MEVKAKGDRNKVVGFYGTKRRYAGETFVLEKDEHFSEKWMEKVVKPGRPPKAEKPAKGEGA